MTYVIIVTNMFFAFSYLQLDPLLFQPSYPRTPCIRKGWVFRQVIKLIIFTGLMGFIIEQVSWSCSYLIYCSDLPFFLGQVYCSVFMWIFWCFDHHILQYINPIVQNSQHPLKGNLLYAIERVLKLSVPNLYVWLCMFYCLFHLWYVFQLSSSFFFPFYFSV